MRLRGLGCNPPIEGRAVERQRCRANACAVGMRAGHGCCHRRWTPLLRRAIPPLRCALRRARRWTCRRSWRPRAKRGASRPTIRCCCCMPLAAASIRPAASPGAAQRARSAWRQAGCSGRTSAPSAIFASVTSGRSGGRGGVMRPSSAAVPRGGPGAVGPCCAGRHRTGIKTDASRHKALRRGKLATARPDPHRPHRRSDPGHPKRLRRHPKPASNSRLRKCASTRSRPASDARSGIPSQSHYSDRLLARILESTPEPVAKS